MYDGDYFSPLINANYAKKNNVQTITYTWKKYNVEGAEVEKQSKIMVAPKLIVLTTKEMSYLVVGLFDNLVRLLLYMYIYMIYIHIKIFT